MTDAPFDNRLALHDAKHILGKAAHHARNGTIPEYREQGIVLCSTRGVALSYGQSSNLFTTAMPIAIDVVAQRHRDEPDVCISASDHASAKRLNMRASIDDRIALHATAMLIYQQGWANQIAAHISDNCGLAKLDLHALTEELVEPMRMLEPLLKLTPIMLDMSIANLPRVTLRTPFAECEMRGADFDRARSIIDSDTCNGAEVLAWVRGRPVKAQQREDAA